MKLKKLILLPLTALALSVSSISAVNAETENYLIDTKGAHASIEFLAKHLGYSWLIGRFNEFSGSFTFDDENPQANSISLVINVASVDSNHAERDKHLRGEKYLNTDKFPQAKFVSTSITPTNGGYAVKGNFTLHGVTKAIEFAAKDVGAGKDPWGGYRRGFEAETEITFADFGYTFNLGPATKTAIIRMNLEGIKK